MKFYILLRLSSLGDIILASGLPGYIKRNEPKAKVVFIHGNSFQGIFDMNPHIDIDVNYEKETRDTQPTLPELAREICSIAKDEKKIEIHFADLQNNKRSYALLYLFKQYLRKEVVTCDLYLSHLELEKYRGAKLAMVWGSYLPFFVTERFGSKQKKEVKDIDRFLHKSKITGNRSSNNSRNITKLDTTARRSMKLRNMLMLPEVTTRYYDTVYGKGLAKRSARKGRKIKIAPEIWLREDLKEKTYLPNKNPDAIEKPYRIGLAPGAAHFTKKWPKERYVELIDILMENHFEVVLIGGPNDTELLESIILDCKYKGIQQFTSVGSIQDTTEIIDGLTALVCGDTAMAHIAFARKIHVFAIFGSTVPELGFAPRASGYQVVQDNSVECRPCTHIGRDSCPKGHFKCMEQITSNQLYRLIMEYIEEFKIP